MDTTLRLGAACLKSAILELFTIAVFPPAWFVLGNSSLERRSGIPLRLWSAGSSVVKLRSEPEDGQLAPDTIHGEDLKTQPSKPGNVRSRAIGRMMFRALSDG